MGPGGEVGDGGVQGWVRGGGGSVGGWVRGGRGQWVGG